MASSKTLRSDSKDAPSSSDSLCRCTLDDITEEPQPSDSNTAVKAQKTGKFKRTALTFLGVRKTICILPSFFVGRSKNLSKWSSKKTIFKSKTHDGLSKACQDDNLRDGYASAGDFIYHSQRDVAGNLCSGCHNKSSPVSGDQKSLSLTRHKRGFRSLFQSIKQHRNNRNDLEKADVSALSATQSERDVPIVQDYSEQCLQECLESKPDVPDFDRSTSAECEDAAVLEKCVLIKDASQIDHDLSDNQIEEMDHAALVSSDYEGLSRVQSDPCLKLEMVPETKLSKAEATPGSFDQLNVMFEDVDSLKSFDSLTGCGDIIADQEDDSLTESTVSGERSRNGGKRASCYLTYQGGGEEMACPENLDEECLDNLWGNDASENMCCACNQDQTDMSSDMTCSHNMDLLNSNSAQKAVDSSIAEVMTPQSEHQESAPNSDEGYYDSTTPGPEEGQEKSDRLQQDRLPRDSYSGDALYELFAPDESLISPHHEKKSLLLGSEESCVYLNEPVDFTDSAFSPDKNNLQIGDELYEDQSFLEMPSSCNKSKGLVQESVDMHEIGLSIQSNMSKTQVLVNSNMKINTSPGKSLNAEHVKCNSGISFGSASDPDFETFCEPKEELEENKPVVLPYRNVTNQSAEMSGELDDKQAICFSQALEDYTKHKRMMSTLHNSIDGLETTPAFIPNMEALPAIVTFDVVDMHNEGEYDDQMQMDLEEDISSPFQEFEESYLQKDAFAECDYQMLDPYEQSILSNKWAIASLPRHLGLTKDSHFLPAPLSQDRRSRSLDTEDLDFNMSNKCQNHRRALVSCFEAEKERGSSYSKMSCHVPLKDRSITMPWQTKSEMALSLSLTDVAIGEVQSGNQTQVNTKTSVSSSTDLQHTKSRHFCTSTSNSASSELFSSPELFNLHCHIPLFTDSCLPHSPCFYDEIMEKGSLLNDRGESLFCEKTVNILCKGSMKTKPEREGLSLCSPNPPPSIDEKK